MWRPEDQEFKITWLCRKLEACLSCGETLSQNNKTKNGILSITAENNTKRIGGL